MSTFARPAFFLFFSLFPLEHFWYFIIIRYVPLLLPNRRGKSSTIPRAQYRTGQDSAYRRMPVHTKPYKAGRGGERNRNKKWKWRMVARILRAKARTRRLRTPVLYNLYKTGVICMGILTVGPASPQNTVLYCIHKLEASLRRTRNWLSFPISANLGVSMRKGCILMSDKLWMEFLWHSWEGEWLGVLFLVFLFVLLGLAEG